MKELTNGNPIQKPPPEHEPSTPNKVLAFIIVGVPLAMLWAKAMLIMWGWLFHG